MSDTAEDQVTSRREQRRLRHQSLSRSQLLDAAEEIFGRKGFHATTLKEIAELAEFSVGSVYSFFQNKDDLFQQIFVRRGDEFMPRLRDVLRPGAAPPVEQLHHLVDFEIGWFRANRHFGRLYLRHSSPTMLSMDREVDAVIAGNYEESMRLQADLFRRGQERGEFRDGDPLVLARLFSGIISAYQALDPAVVSDAPGAPGAAERFPLSELHDLVEAAFVRTPARRGRRVAGPARPTALMPSLHRLGLDAVYGAPLDGTPVVEVPPELAPLLAAAHLRVLRRPAGVHAGGGAIVDAAGRPVGPVAAAGGDQWQEPPDDVVAAVSSAEAPVVLAGPGVVLADAVAGLHALAAAGSLGVLNTWGAKGVFDWRSRHRLATAGLQGLDFARGGLAEADLIIATGVDEREARADWRLAPVVEVAPGALGPLAERWGRPRTEIAVPPLRAGLARVTQAGWQVGEAPLPPTRVTRHYGAVLGTGGLVAADPGLAGYWVARTFATTGIGGAQVPADPGAAGFAVAAALVARVAAPGRPVLAVVDDLAEVHGRLLEVAGRLGVTVPVEQWAGDGEALAADAHLERLESLVAGGGRATIATDPRQLDEMVEVAGPIVAWAGG